MKKNNGFTLIELVATVIILAAIALVTFPILLNTIKNSEGQIDDVTKKLVINAAKLYIDNNLNDYPPTEGNTYCIPVDNLIQSKHLEKGVIDTVKIDSTKITVKVIVNDNYDYEIVNNGECTVIVNNDNNNEQDNNIEYCFETTKNDDGTLTISDYKCNYTDITIPDEIGEQTVTVIGAEVFQNKGLTNVVLPSTLKTIGERAFSYNKLYVFDDIDDVYDNIDIPQTVTYIGAAAFIGNDCSIQDYVYNRKSNGEIDYTSINSYCAGGTIVEQIIIPEKVTHIGDEAFGGSVYLSEGVVLPEGLISIGKMAFRGTGLTGIVIPETVTYIGEAAFINNNFTEDEFVYNRTSKGSIDYTSLNSYVGDSKTVSIQNGIITIGDHAFYSSSIESVNIPDGVEEIGISAFGANKLKSVTIPSSVNSIGDMAFYDNQLTSIRIKGKTSSAAFTSYGNSIWGWADGYSDSNIIWNG